MRKFDLKKWEIALVCFSLLLFFFALALYVSDFPLRKYFAGLDTEEGQKKIGNVVSKQGLLRRELIGESEFKAIDVSALLFNRDMIVTGADGKATLMLDDGATIDMDPSSMIFLSYESRLTLTGIEKTASVNIVSGNVTGRAKSKPIILRSGKKVIAVKRDSAPQSVKAPPPPPPPQPEPEPLPSLAAVVTPSPSPSPTIDPNTITSIELVEPKAGTVLIVPKGSRVAARSVELKWRMKPPEAQALIVIRQEGRKGETEVLRETVVSKAGEGAFSWTAKQPGRYEWEIRQIDDKPIAQAVSHFEIDPKFEGIHPHVPLVAGERAASNRLRDKHKSEFDVKLKWDPYPEARKYRIWLAKSATAKKPILEKEFNATVFSLNKGKVFNDQIYYRVFAETSNGFIVSSPVREFIFNFDPPALVTPANKAMLRHLAKGDKGVLLTWQKTNFTESYEIEIALDEGFKKIYFKETRTENFLVMKDLPPNRYWWRVRSLAKAISSKFGTPYWFSVSR